MCVCVYVCVLEQVVDLVKLGSTCHGLHAGTPCSPCIRPPHATTLAGRARSMYLTAHWLCMCVYGVVGCSCSINPGADEKPPVPWHARASAVPVSGFGASSVLWRLRHSLTA